MVRFILRALYQEFEFSEVLLRIETFFAWGEKEKPAMLRRVREAWAVRA